MGGEGRVTPWVPVFFVVFILIVGEPTRHIRVKTRTGDPLRHPPKRMGARLLWGPHPHRWVSSPCIRKDKSVTRIQRQAVRDELVTHGVDRPRKSGPVFFVVFILAAAGESP